MKKTINGGVFFLLFFFIFSNQYLYAKKTVYAGLYENPPLSYMDKKGYADGLFPNILNIIADNNDLHIVYKKCQWKQCLQMLSSGTIDILSPIAKTKSREKEYLFSSETILTNYGTIYTGKKEKINFWTDLNDKKIGLLKGDIHADIFMENIKNFKINASIFYYDSYKKLFNELHQKKLNAIVANSVIFLNYLQKFPDIKKTDIFIDEIPVTFAFNKNDKELKNMTDNALKNYKIDVDSKYYKLLHRYLDIKVQKNRYLKYTLIALLTLAGLILLLLFINLILHNMVKKATSVIEEKYQKELYLNKIINTVKNVNQVLLEGTDIEDKLGKVCEKITEENLYEMACIAIAKKDKLDIVSHSKKFSQNKISLDMKSPKANHIIETLKNDMTTVAKFSEKDCFFKDRMDTKNLTYILATPIKCEDKKEPYGIIMVHTTKKYGFRKKEISLIEELAGDVSLCLKVEYLKETNLQFLTDRIKNYKEMVFALNKAIEARDPYTAGHNSRVSEYATLIAKQMGLSDKDIEDLQKAGELHDIGKIETPDSILLKPGKLNGFEYDIIKMHPKKGYEILSKMTFLKDVSEIILYHHERYDGSGYPFGLKKEKIPLLSQILSIADTFDAMTTNRIYKPAKNKSDALKEIESLSGIWFDKNLVDHTLKALKDIDIKDSAVFEQTPKDPLLDARFAYFFKDHLTECYNVDYLKHLYIIEDIYNFDYIYTFAINNFTNFNKNHSWEKGDELLIEISKALQENSKTSKVFRVKGDDFIIISKKELDINGTLLDIFKRHDIITYRTNTYTIDEINTLEKLKELIREI